MNSRFRPSPAMAVACTALLVALGGTSYAVTQLPANSVGTTQLKNDAVISSKVKKDSLTGADVKESTLGLVPKAANALKLGGKLPSAFLPVGGKAVDASHADNATLLQGLGTSAFLAANGKAVDSTHADSATDSSQLGGVAANQYMKLGVGTSLEYNPVAMVTADADLTLNRGPGKVTVFSSTTGSHKVWLPVAIPDRGGTLVIRLFTCYHVSNVATSITETRLLQGNNSGTSQTSLIDDTTSHSSLSACYTSLAPPPTALVGGPLYVEYTINFNSTSHTVEFHRSSLLYSDSS